MDQTRCSRNALAPTDFDTPLIAGVLADPEYLAWITTAIPAGTVGQPEELMGAILFPRLTRIEHGRRLDAHGGRRANGDLGRSMIDTDDALRLQLEKNAAAEAELAARIREAGVEYIYYQFLSLSGRVLAKVAPADQLARNLSRGVQFHGSAVTDLAVGRDGGLIASGYEREESWPSPTHRRSRSCHGIRHSVDSSAIFYRRTDLPERPGEPLATCVRGALSRGARALPSPDRLRATKRHRAGDELAGRRRISVVEQRTDPSYHMGALELMRPIVKRVITYAREFGLTMIEGDYEDNGQVELNFQYDNCELTCDRLITYRQICSQVADEFGVTATFMPKPSETAMANGCHHNLSLWSGGENVFIDPGNPQIHVTEVARHAVGGLLSNSRSMLAFLASTVNSYARYWHVGAFAPTIANWGFDNRTCAIRVSASGRLSTSFPTPA